MTALVQRFARNTTGGRDLIVGDIHGAFSKLQLALNRVSFDPERDRLFSVGDLVDRGAESDQYADWLAKPWFHAVRGNHEEMAIYFARGELEQSLYAANGGTWNIVRHRAEQQETAADFMALPIAIELETHAGLVGIVHADVPFKSWQDFTACLERETGQMLESVIGAATWSRSRISNEDDTGVRGVRAVVVGHTPLNAPRALGNVLHIDTGGWMGVAGGVREFTIINAATLARPLQVVTA